MSNGITKAENKVTALTAGNDMTAEFEVLPAGSHAGIRYTTTADEVQLFNVLNGTGGKVADYLGQEVKVTGIVISSSDVLKDMNDDENGERECKPVVHFILDSSEQISSISNGIIRAARNLLSVGFIPTPEKPFTIRFKEVKTKKGTAHSFDLISK